MPPGIQGIIQYLTKPWGEVVDGYALQVIALTNETDHVRDRCIHTFSRADDPETIPTITLDWQRVLKQPRPAKGNVEHAAEEGARDALAYFEKLGERGLNG